MAFRIEIDSLTFNDGPQIPIPPNGVVVLVGPNNAGKTAALKGIRSILKGGRVEGRKHRVVSEVGIKCSDVSEQAVLDWLRESCQTFVNTKTDIRTFYRGQRNYMYTSSAQSRLTESVSNPENGFGDIIDVLSIYLDPQVRLEATQTVTAIAFNQEPAEWPIQELLSNEAIERELRGEALRAFGSEFVICRASDKNIYTYWGKEPEFGVNRDRLHEGYLQELRRLPRLDEQGDGVRSYLGTLFFLKLAKEQIVFIDEPEAFLHPPHAYRLGALVGQLGQNRQVFVATHSSDFLRGVTDARDVALTIVHLRRNQEKNTPKVLRGDEIRTVTENPVLRYSKLMDGLFHDIVILCESENDCRFYQYVFDQLLEAKDAPNTSLPDALFVDVGGKTGFPSAAEAMTSLGIPVRVIADFDILNALNPLAKVVTVLGGNWAAHEKDWQVVKQSVEQQGAAPPLIEDVKNAIRETLSKIDGKRITEAAAEKIRDISRYPSPWTLAKKHGKSTIPNGEATQAVESLLSGLSAIGIHIVPSGELESWVKTATGKSGAWLEQVFTQLNQGEITIDQRVFEFVRMAASVPGKQVAAVAADLLTRRTQTSALRHSNKPNPLFDPNNITPSQTIAAIIFTIALLAAMTKC